MQEKSDLSWLQDEYECDACGISIAAVLTNRESLESDIWMRMVLEFSKRHTCCGFEL